MIQGLFGDFFFFFFLFLHHPSLLLRGTRIGSVTDQGKYTADLGLRSAGCRWGARGSAGKGREIQSSRSNLQFGGGR